MHSAGVFNALLAFYRASRPRGFRSGKKKPNNIPRTIRCSGYYIYIYNTDASYYMCARIVGRVTRLCIEIECCCCCCCFCMRRGHYIIIYTSVHSGLASRRPCCIITSHTHTHTRIYAHTRTRMGVVPTHKRVYKQV